MQSPARKFNPSLLREISQTGSVLSPEGFERIYREVKQDIHFNSISGDTDINGCFAADSPTLPVYAGELQARALSMKGKAYDEKGDPVPDQRDELFWTIRATRSTSRCTSSSTSQWARTCSATAIT